jgi:hypothetical protein
VTSALDLSLSRTYDRAVRANAPAALTRSGAGHGDASSMSDENLSLNLAQLARLPHGLVFTDAAQVAAAEGLELIESARKEEEDDGESASAT